MDFTTYEPRISALEAGGGGGGSSDFSTAQVTIKPGDTSITDANAGLYNVLDLDEDIWIITTALIHARTNPYTKTVVLYQGKTYLFYNQNNNVIESVSGNIAYDDDLGMYVITGDCTVMLANEQAT